MGSRSFALASVLPLDCLVPNPPPPATLVPAAATVERDASTMATGLHIDSMTATGSTASAENDDEAVRYIREHGRCQTVVSRKDVEPRLDAGRIRSRLPPAVIQRIVREKYPLFRACYEDGLRRDPHLKGRISIRFVIEGDGTVSHVSNESSEIGDAEFLRCMNDRCKDLCFPQVEGGIVTVVYPLMFSPGN
jgi:hypothetical protein